MLVVCPRSCGRNSKEQCRMVLVESFTSPRDSLLWSAYWNPSVHCTPLLLYHMSPPPPSHSLSPLPSSPLPLAPITSLWPPSLVFCSLQLFVHCHDLFYLDLSNNQISESLHKPHVSSHTRHTSLYPHGGKERHASFQLVCTVCMFNAPQLDTVWQRPGSGELCSTRRPTPKEQSVYFYIPLVRSSQFSQ